MTHQQVPILNIPYADAAAAKASHNWLNSPYTFCCSCWNRHETGKCWLRDCKEFYIVNWLEDLSDYQSFIYTLKQLWLFHSPFGLRISTLPVGWLGADFWTSDFLTPMTHRGIAQPSSGSQALSQLPTFLITSKSWHLARFHSKQLLPQMTSKTLRLNPGRHWINSQQAPPPDLWRLIKQMKWWRLLSIGDLHVNPVYLQQLFWPWLTDFVCDITWSLVWLPLVAMGTPIFKHGAELPSLSRAKSKSNQIYLEPNSVCPSKGFTLSTVVTPSVLGPWTGSGEIRNLSDIYKWGVPLPGTEGAQ